MDFLKRNGKRIIIDTVGYILVLIAIPISWIPGPGGLPVLIAGLGLLSINNAWAQRLRDYVLDNGGKLVKVLFPANPTIEFIYDILAVVLWVLVVVLVWQHAATWQIGVAVSMFFAALTIALLNRDRLNRIRGKSKR